MERLILWKPAKGNLLARVGLVYIDIILTDIKAAAGWGCSQNSTEWDVVNRKLNLAPDKFQSYSWLVSRHNGLNRQSLAYRVSLPRVPRQEILRWNLAKIKGPVNAGRRAGKPYDMIINVILLMPRHLALQQPGTHPLSMDLTSSVVAWLNPSLAESEHTHRRTPRRHR